MTKILHHYLCICMVICLTAGIYQFYQVILTSSSTILVTLVFASLVGASAMLGFAVTIYVRFIRTGRLP